MHNSYYFLSQLCFELNNLLKDTRVVSCFSQQKDELIIEFASTSASFFIKAHLLPGFSCLSFPTSFHRARKNSVELFDETNLKVFIEAKEFENERAFSIALEDELSLIFKMHGNRSNVLLAKSERIVKIFKNDLKTDFALMPSGLNRKIDWSESFFLKHRHNIRQHYFTWSKPVWRYLDNKGFGNLSPPEQWQAVSLTMQLLENPGFYVVETGGLPGLSLLSEADSSKQNDSPVQAITEFFQRYVTADHLLREKHAAIRDLEKRLAGAHRYIEKNSALLQRAQHDHQFRLWADLIMANLHVIPTGANQIMLDDFAEDKAQQKVTVKLNPEFTPQKNAEVFYRKARHHNIEVGKLQEGIQLKTMEAESLGKKLNSIKATQSIASLRNLVYTSSSSSAKKKASRLPYHAGEFRSYQIWIGRNASDNDELTQKHSHKEDLWLHAKDVAGSHVLVKHQAGKRFPKDVIERAAALAAWHSKRRTEGLVPVAYTAKKFVRKRKGDPAGVVVVERETIILVEPKGLS